MDNCVICGQACESFSEVRFWKISGRFTEFNFHPQCMNGFKKITSIINSQDEYLLTEDEAAQIASSLFESEYYE